ncbi:histidinol-phosphate aminotransferase [Pseudovirgaria hyperparasitica]|uniref:histidinol-phosphate transaminase n=1 Tax=Pseudovirgaria hyperparasitica TaxID=470096 RepID=A0A6A6W5B3_9PEZI|nr:histidinol-phosphate aminotransferase [Pseudovirgaria hyperparasitica]KAF2757735.1 histidinol-phosphate aminotransferase [Pseudovirgaria hyperparasitica]
MTHSNSAFDLEKCARPNILHLQPYRCARDDYKDDGTNVLLDANENAYGPGLALNKAGGVLQQAMDGTPVRSLDFDLRGLNRYPDPHQSTLKQLLCNLRNAKLHTTKTLTPENLFVGVGSDEAIDALLRCFCAPGKDKILTCPPTYGMYAVSAQVNDVSIVNVPLIASENFALDVQGIKQALSEDSTIKLVYLCTPGNPTGATLPKSAIMEIVHHPTWNGIVVLDEAYIDFSPPEASLAEWVLEVPNLVVMQTLSKAFGLAGIRLGAAFTSTPIARLLNSLKAPYNISSPTSQIATAALSPEHLQVMQENREKIMIQRERLLREMPKIAGVGRFLGGTDANFLLVEMLDGPEGKPSNVTAQGVYEALAEQKGVVVRFRGKEHGCTGALRITVGTEQEVDRFLVELKSVLSSIHNTGSKVSGDQEEKEQAANDVVA